MCLHCIVFICVLTAQPSMRSEMGLIYIVGTHKNGVIADQQTGDTLVVNMKIVSALSSIFI